jgi:hypothetical protein
MSQAEELKLDEKAKDTIASEIAEVFFEFWQNRRSKQEIEAVAPIAVSSEDSCILEQQP